MSNRTLSGLFLLTLAAAQAQAQVPVEAWRLGKPVASANGSMAAMEHHAISLGARADLRDADALSFELPEGVISLQRRDLEARGPGDFTWIGGPAGRRDRSALLTVVPGAIAGLIQGDEHLYEIGTAADGTVLLTRLAPERFPDCAGGIDAGIDPHASAQLPPARQAGTGDLEIDVLVLYTPQSRSGAGGTSQIRAVSQAAVDAANMAFANSDMITRFRVVAIEQWNRDESTLGSGASARLSTLRADPGIAALRTAVGADMVGLIVEDGQGACGIGYVMRSPGPSFAGSAYQLTARGCAVGNLTYAHEHGHNMGFEHDPENGTSPANASFPWSFGHYEPASFRTVMSYQCPSGNCTRRAFFSNPDVSYQDLPTGIADQRDNARSGDLVFEIIRDFRPRVELTSVFVDGFE
jgi:peptidyl-Asp metalloendopeptidase